MSDKPITHQRIYAVLRKAGYPAAKWHASGQVRGWGNWSPGVRVEDAGADLVVTYKVYGSGGEERIRNIMQNSIRSALKSAGIDGTLSEGGQTYTVAPNAPAAVGEE